MFIIFLKFKCEKSFTFISRKLDEFDFGYYFASKNQNIFFEMYIDEEKSKKEKTVTMSTSSPFGKVSEPIDSMF